MPHSRYQDIDENGLVRLHDGLDMLERLDPEAIADLDIVLYGLTQQESVTDAAREAIADEAEIDESDVQLTEVAVCIPLSSDTIHYLTGSGLKLRNEEFAYMGGQGEGIRSTTFTFSHFKPTVSTSDFSQMAIAVTVSWLDDFLKQYGNKQPAVVKQNVHRTEEATQPGIPAPAPPPVTPTPKTTSLTGGLKFADFIENFLG